MKAHKIPMGAMRTASMAMKTGSDREVAISTGRIPGRAMREQPTYRKPAMRTTLLPISLIALFLMTACSDSELGPIPVPEDHAEQVQAWKEYRIGRLTEPTGWLRLVDLIWLEEGENRFGSGPESDIRFPEGTIASDAGRFTLRNGIVEMSVNDQLLVTRDGQPVSEAVIYDGDPESERVELVHKDLIWFVDRRGDQYGIRLFNLDTPDADAFRGFPSYPLDEAWYLRGRFHPYEEEHAIPVVNVLGETVRRPSPGWIEFEVDGERLTLDAFESASGLFLMFTDATNRDDTYQAGRYLIIDHPDENADVVVDFNRTYNMPCSFSPFTTCQLPPPQNRLEIAITAGEKRPVGWQGFEPSSPE